MRALRQLSDLFTAAVPADDVPAPKETPGRAARLPPTSTPPTVKPANNHQRTTRSQPHPLPGSTAIFDRRVPQPPRVLIPPLPSVAPRTHNKALPGGQQQRMLTDRKELVECTAPPRATPLVRPPPPSSPRVPMRQQQSPAPAWAPTTIRLPPPRPHPISFPCPKLSTPIATNRQYPHLIAPDEDDPIRHRYPLRSQLQANSLVQTVRHAFDGVNSCNAVVDEATGDAQEYRHLMRTPARKVWETSLANDLGRLAQGVGTRMPTGNSTIRFVSRQTVPAHKKVTYARLVAELRPHKKEVHRVRVTVGGDKLEYTGITATQTASLTTTKCLINSTLSTDRAKFMSVDIKDYYYGTILSDFEYMRMALKDISDEIIVQYNLRALQCNDWVYIQIDICMPGLK